MRRTGPARTPHLLVLPLPLWKTADIEKQEGEDDGESRADSSGSSSGAEATVPSAEYTAEEEPKKPVVLSSDEGDDLREAGRECQPRFRRSVADAGLPQREARCIQGLLLLPELLASRSAAVERKTADIEKQEGEDDGESRADSSGSSSGAEATVPSAEYTAEEEPKKPVVPSRDEGDDLREAGRECQPRFRRRVADAAAWSFWG
ncbi:hypothetical protein NDU88_002114 [Pleurodeles waltl]|uniref:Uncharacterized protein n=1 Tax=Pleurodeles waltl TaxID=8319 RepID=A0AAV7TJV6_PLEWA|nr:hypothetical protein NDU88_002114 [Pleurodeles waltl]